MQLGFDEIAWKFDSQRGLPTEAIAAWIDLVSKLSDGRILSIVEPGIGTGRVALPLAAAGHRVAGVDTSPEMLRVCEEVAAQLELSRNVQMALGDATALPYQDHAFDAGIVAQLLYLVPDWPSVLDELARVVKPGGFVIHVTEPTTESEALARWSGTWREMIEATGYHHRPLQPTDEDVRLELLRRWPDVEQHELAQWTFGQSVSDAMAHYADRVRPLYVSVPEPEFDQAVTGFLAWAAENFPDPEVRLEGIVTFTATVART